MNIHSFFFLIIHSYAFCSLDYYFKQLFLYQKIGQLFMVAAVVDEKSNEVLIHNKSYQVDSEYIKFLIKNITLEE